MPINQGYTTVNGKRMGYYQWGSEGKKYYYTPGDESERERAYQKALNQQRAARAGGYEG